MTINLENDKIKVTLSTYAGYIESIVNKETSYEHWWRYDSKFWPRRTSICFPICGSLVDGEYIYQGKTYQMPMHGFLREKEFTLVEQGDNRVVMEHVSNEDTYAIYPFNYKFTLIQEVLDNSLIISYLVENIGKDDMYYSVGSHYTYNVPIVDTEKQQDYHYKFGGPQNAGKFIMTDGVVSGKTSDIFSGKSTLDISGLFEDGSTILELSDINPKHIAIESKRDGSFTKVAFDGFSYCVLWAPKGISPFACIEPWTGLPDQTGHDKDIVKKLGITKLEKGMSNKYVQTITVG